MKNSFLLIFSLISLFTNAQSLGFYLPKMEKGGIGIAATKGGLTNNSVFSASAAYAINSTWQASFIYGSYSPIFNNSTPITFFPGPLPTVDEFGDVQNRMHLYEGAISAYKTISEKAIFQISGFCSYGTSKWVNQKGVAAGTFDILNYGINPMFLLGKFSDRAKFRYMVGSRLSMFSLTGNASAAYLKRNQKMLDFSYQLADHSTFFDAQLLLGCTWNFFNSVNNIFGVTIPLTKVQGTSNIFAPIALSYTLGIEVNKLFKKNSN